MPGQQIVRTEPTGNTTTQLMNESGNQSSSGSTTAQGAGTTQQANTYLPWQGPLQEQVGQAAGNFLQTGSLPGTFGAPPGVSQAFTNDFNRFVAPKMAANLGAGSAAIPSALALGLEQLNAKLYQQQSGAFGGALASAGNLAFNPVGNTSQQAQTSQTQNDADSDWQRDLESIVTLAQAATQSTTTLP